MSRDLPTLAENLAGADTPEREQALARTRAGYARIGFFPDRRRTDSRAYFAVVDELASRTRRATAAPSTSRSSSPAEAQEEQS
jgi:hypothetical protein